MPSAVEQLLHDAAYVDAFLAQIGHFRSQQQSSQIYVDPTTEFFHYVKQLEEASRAFVVALDAGRVDATHVGLARATLQDIKNYWRLLHAFIKPAADAHVLQVPAPLIEFATSQIRRIPGFANANVVLLLTPELMYFQDPHTDLKLTAAELAHVIPQAGFSVQLGFIELPFSQGSNLFTNLVLYHELGHFVFEELCSAPQPGCDPGQIEGEIRMALNAHWSGYAALSADEKAFFVGILRSWSQEIFCDLFALHLIGPAFTFAFIEVFSLLGLQDTALQTQFTESHPSDALRFAEHLAMLTDTGWWDHIQTLDSWHRVILEECAGKSGSSSLHIDGQPYPDPGLVDAFKDVLPTLRDMVRHISAETTTSAENFARLRPEVESALLWGVVPPVHPSGQPGAGIDPDPVSIINAAFCFYLTRLPELLRNLNLSAERTPEVQARSFWAARLQTWTLKAVEDHQIMSKRESRV
jgi:hypothetical protein